LRHQTSGCEQSGGEEGGEPSEAHQIPRLFQAQGLLVSGSWDRVVKFWDLREPSGRSLSTLVINPSDLSPQSKSPHQPQQQLQLQQQQHGEKKDEGERSKAGGAGGGIKVKEFKNEDGARVFSMSLQESSSQLVVGYSGRLIASFDLRTLSSSPDPNVEPVFARESSLKFQTRCVACYPIQPGFAIGSIEGRVGMEYFDNTENQTKKYAFKCHRINFPDGAETVHPVNAISFHPIYGTFVTGGGEGTVNFWDGDNKKRLHQLPRFSTSIASLSFNSDGSLLAIASSYTFELGPKDSGLDQIFIHPVSESEVKPKPRVVPQ